MHHRRSHSDPGDAKDNDASLDASVDEVESVSDSESSVHTVDLYRGWRLPDLNFSMRIPAWIVILATLLLFKGPSMPPLCVA
jgi:hypothetical protein